MGVGGEGGEVEGGVQGGSHGVGEAIKQRTSSWCLVLSQTLCGIEQLL